jgi:integrase
VSAAKPVSPGTVNRELDTLRLIFGKAVAWKKLAEAPRIVKLKVDNVRRRVLTDQEQANLIAASPKKLRCLVMLLLLTGARVAETLALRWEDVSEDGVLTFLHTKTGKIRCVGGTEEIQTVLNALPRAHAHVFASPRTGKAYTGDGLRSMLRRALRRAHIDPSGCERGHQDGLRHPRPQHVADAPRTVRARIGDAQTIGTRRASWDRWAHSGHTRVGGATGVEAHERIV